MSFKDVEQGFTAAVAALSLAVSFGAYRRSGARVSVHVERCGVLGDEPQYLQSIAVVVHNRGDAPITVEMWGFDLANRWGWPRIRPFQSRRGLSCHSFSETRGDVPTPLKPGELPARFYVPLAEVQKFVQPPTRLRAIVLVGHRPRFIKSRRSVSVTDFEVLARIDESHTRRFPTIKRLRKRKDLSATQRRNGREAIP